MTEQQRVARKKTLASLSGRIAQCLRREDRQWETTWLWEWTRRTQLKDTEWICGIGKWTENELQEWWKYEADKLKRFKVCVCWQQQQTAVTLSLWLSWTTETECWRIICCDGSALGDIFHSFSLNIYYRCKSANKVHLSPKWSFLCNHFFFFSFSPFGLQHPKARIITVECRVLFNQYRFETSTWLQSVRKKKFILMTLFYIHFETNM